ncbi:hypothetical protein R1sor_017328 [Riccia sorocarpa]|uniref:Uncharacterized protein n=1 Tax=Riccia sorocarpa TaxID=122646 RepID=A0ABD3I6W6_9MARC
MRHRFTRAILDREFSFGRIRFSSKGVGNLFVAPKSEKIKKRSCGAAACSPFLCCSGEGISVEATKGNISNISGHRHAKEHERPVFDELSAALRLGGEKGLGERRRSDRGKIKQINCRSGFVEEALEGADLREEVISEYRLAALQASPQSHGTALRPCIVRQGKPNSPVAPRFYWDPKLQCSLCTLSAYEAGGAASISRRRTFTEGKNLTGIGGRFRQLNGPFFPLSDGVSRTLKQGLHIRAGLGIGPDESFEGESKDGGLSSVWGLTAGPHKGLLGAADKIGDYFWNMMTNTDKKRQDHMNNTTSSTAEEKESEPENVETDWERWQEVFMEVEDRERLTSTLTIQLQEAVEKEHAQGRFIAKSYNARQLTAGKGPEAPLFEIFVKKTGKNDYSLHAVYLKHEGNMSDSSDSDTTESDLIVDDPEGIQSNIPKIGLKPADTNPYHDHDGSSTGIDKDMIHKTSQDPIFDDHDTVHSSSDIVEKQENQGSSGKLLSTGATQNSTLSDDEDVAAPVRIPAKLESKTKDSFTFQFEEVYQPGSWRSTIAQSEAICGRAELNVENGSMADKPSSATVVSKVATEMGKLARQSVTQARRSQRLAEITSFRRINTGTLETGSDPLSGLYVGDFGFYTSHLEVVQLRRRFGNWGEDKDKLEFFQYVEAVKLTGKLDFPAGEVMFRAKIGEGNRLYGLYPGEFGVIARYKGQGRRVEPGSRIEHTQWLDGQLVLLDPKSASRMRGSELGFVYNVQERPSLVLFNRLKLQD